MDPRKVLSINLEDFQNLTISRATGKEVDETLFKALREHLVKQSEIKDLLPRFAFTCRDSTQFWTFIKDYAPTYKARKEYLWKEFQPALMALDQSPHSIPASIKNAILKFNSESVNAEWVKALDRRSSDPSGAITIARTLLESVCKHILDEYASPYTNSDDLPKLYAKCSKILNIAPSQHTEDIFKQILGGCTAVVEGLGALRNRISDAHGNGKKAAKPNQRHAHLAVNLSGSMATFLIETWESKNSK